MSKRFVSEGDVIAWTATGNVTNTHTLIRSNQLIGMPLSTGVTGTVIQVQRCGVWDATKPTGVAFAAMAPVYITAANVLSSTATSANRTAGFAVAAATAGAGVDRVKVCLQGQVLGV